MELRGFGVESRGFWSGTLGFVELRGFWRGTEGCGELRDFGAEKE